MFPDTLQGYSDAKKAMELVKSIFKQEYAIPNAVFHFKCKERVSLLEKELEEQQNSLVTLKKLSLLKDAEWNALPIPSDTASESSLLSSRPTIKAEKHWWCAECKTNTTHEFVKCPKLLNKIRTGPQWATKHCRYCHEPTQPNGHLASVSDGESWYPMCPKLIFSIEKKKRQEAQETRESHCCSPCNSMWSDS